MLFFEPPIVGGEINSFFESRGGRQSKAMVAKNQAKHEETASLSRYVIL
jgi:hypothetical protein